ncbi:EamA family transporter [Thermoflavimicrobium daqui]|jgi:drug/metabolite transporter (DMT)-like permease|uniref:Multidrug transporter n=1 Tax=Thermoflavimicrobium daqui TaxID=2137476 RepID=A0A364K2Q4_9BACL|nr:DMT family transporter [Thermoflavimicrobium daqui]RAL22667.1 multidrug transporter [Thermoflavimicrobium daqui]
MKRFVAIGSVLLGAASYGAMSAVIKLGYQAGFTPKEITGAQAFIGCLGLWLIFLPMIKKVREVRKKNVFSLVVCGVASGMTGIFYYLSLKELPVSIGIILLFQFAWMGMIVESFQKRKWPLVHQWVAIAVILLGTYFAAGLTSTPLEQISTRGIIYGLIAAASYTGFLHFSGNVANHVYPLFRSALMQTGTMIFIFIIYPPEFLISGALPKGLWIWGGLLGIFSTMIPTILFARALPHVGTGLGAILSSIELPTVIIMSHIVLREQITWLQWVGVFLILLGIMIANRKVTLQQSNVKENSCS